jgi:hypothetical protein
MNFATAGKKVEEVLISGPSGMWRNAAAPFKSDAIDAEYS